MSVLHVAWEIGDNQKRNSGNADYHSYLKPFVLHASTELMFSQGNNPRADQEHNGNGLQDSPFDCAAHFNLLDVKFFLLLIGLFHFRLFFKWFILFSKPRFV